LKDEFKYATEFYTISNSYEIPQILIEIDCEGLTNEEANTILYRFLKDLRKLKGANKIFNNYKVNLKGDNFD